MSESLTKYIGTFLEDTKSLLPILKHSTWNYFNQVLDYTRSYEDGLIILTRLLKEVENNKNSISNERYEDHLKLIYFKLLDYLDKLDRWEEYLEAWENIFTNVKIGLTYSIDKLKQDGVAPFILKIDKSIVYLHFLYMGHHRKELIERRLENKRAGKYLGKLHEQQSELTQEELNERYKWIVNYLSTGSYDMNPPASRQRKKRLEEKRNAFDVKNGKL